MGPGSEFIAIYHKLKLVAQWTLTFLEPRMERGSDGSGGKPGNGFKDQSQGVSDPCDPLNPRHPCSIPADLYS